jgi:hypothetical protein
MNCNEKNNEKNDFSKKILNFIYKSYETHDLLNIYYLPFWKNIYYNEVFVLYKEAITTLKDMNFYLSFNRKIQKYLYTGICEYVKMNKYKFHKEFNSSNIKPEYICKLIRNIIYLLDQIFEIIPRTPIDLISYRLEYRNSTDKIFNLEKGDIYYNLSFLMTSIYPLHIIESSFFPKNKNIEKKIVNFIFIIPKNSMAYYIYNPWINVNNKNLNNNIVFDNDKNIIGHQENELVLPRGCYWYVIDKKILGENEICYIMYLIEQSKNEILNKNEYKLQNEIIIKKKNISNKIKINCENLQKNFETEIKLKLELKLFIQKFKEKINIEEKNLNKNFNEINNILKIITEKNINNENFKKKLNKILNWNKIIKEIEIKKETLIEIFITPNKFNLYIYIYYEIFNKKNIIRINFPLTFYLKNCKNNFELIKYIDLYKSFTQYEIFHLLNNKTIKESKDIRNNLLVHSNEFPLFFILNIKLKNNIQAYDLYHNHYYNDNPFKKYLYFNSSNIIINDIKKIYIGPKRYYCIITGFME